MSRSMPTRKGVSMAPSTFWSTESRTGVSAVLFVKAEPGAMPTSFRWACREACPREKAWAWHPPLFWLTESRTGVSPVFFMKAELAFALVPVTANAKDADERAIGGEQAV